MTAAAGLRARASSAGVAAAAAAAEPMPARKRPSRSSSRADAYATFEVLPPFQRDNSFIHKYYRTDYTVRRSLRSLFQLHNETGNIWTHLIGALVFVTMFVVTARLATRPLMLGASALRELESRVASAGAETLWDLVSGAEHLQGRVARLGRDAEHALRAVHVGDLLGRLQSKGSDAFNAIESYGSDAFNALESYGSDAFNAIESYGSDALRSLESYGSDALRSLDRSLDSSKARLEHADAISARVVAAVLGGAYPAARWPIHVFVATGVLCLTTSAICHLFGCCRAHIATRIWRADYAGIAVLIVGSFFPPLYYGLACSPAARVAYLVATVVLGALVLCFSLLDRFQKPELYRLRAATFVALGLWGVVPASHLVLTNRDPAVRQACALVALSGTLYIVGAALYASRFPERARPGRFDVVGHSHQLFHVCVVVAALIHYAASKQFHDLYNERGGCIRA